MAPYFKKYIKLIFGIISLLFLKVFFTIKSSHLKGNLIDIAIGEDLFALKKIIILFLFVVVFSVLFGYFYSIKKNIFRQKVMKSIKDDLLEKILLNTREEIRKLDTASIISIYTNQLEIIENNFIFTGFSSLEYLTIIIFSVIALFKISWKIALVALVVYSLPILVTKTFQNKLSTAQQATQEENKNHVNLFLKNIKGMEAIKNYNIENNIITTYDDSLNHLKNCENKRENVRANTNGISSISMYFTTGIMTIYSLSHVIGGSLSPGDFVTVFSLCSLIQSPMFWLARMLEQVYSSLPAIESIKEILEKDNVEEVEFKKPLEEDLALELENISFSYGENKVLENLDLKIKKNEKILIYGESGSGKTTLIDLILKYIKADSGNIYSLNSLDEKVYSKQRDHIFPMSLKENIFCSKDSVENIIKSLNIDYLENVKIEKNGNNLSGGERKRISLARALSQDSKLLILDEPLANIDEKNISNIVQFILGIEDKTIIIISHQFNRELINGVDYIYKLENKKLAEKKKSEFILELENEK